MSNWTQLNETEYKLIWDYIYEVFCFKPNSIKSEIIRLPVKNKCFDISKFYDQGFSLNLYNDLHTKVIHYFIEISDDQRWYALNWQHSCYSFNPKLPFEKDEFEEWLISAFPNGDYVFFLSNNFENGIFGNGIDLELCFFGDQMLKSIQGKPADILRNI